MTNTKKNAPTGDAAKAAKKPTFEYQGFVSCDLRRSDRDDFKAWSADQGDAALFDFIAKAVDSGYKFSVGEGKNGLTASLANVDGPVEARGYILASIAGDAARAIEVLFYKHLVMLEDGWPVGQDADDHFR